MAAGTWVMLSSWCTLGAAERPWWEGLGLALPGCCIMGLTAAMLAAPYLRTGAGSRVGSGQSEREPEALGLPGSSGWNWERGQL